MIRVALGPNLHSAARLRLDVLLCTAKDKGSVFLLSCRQRRWATHFADVGDHRSGEIKWKLDGAQRVCIGFWRLSNAKEAPSSGCTAIFHPSGSWGGGLRCATQKGWMNTFKGLWESSAEICTAWVVVLWRVGVPPTGFGQWCCFPNEEMCAVRCQTPWGYLWWSASHVTFAFDRNGCRIMVPSQSRQLVADVLLTFIYSVCASTLSATSQAHLRLWQVQRITAQLIVQRKAHEETTPTVVSR